MKHHFIVFFAVVAVGRGKKRYLIWKNASQLIRCFHIHQTLMFLGWSDMVLLIWLSACEIISSEPAWFIPVLRSRVLDMILFQPPVCIRGDGLLLSFAVCWSRPVARLLISRTLSDSISSEQRTADEMFVEPESPEQTKVRKSPTAPSAWLNLPFGATM